MSEAVYIVPVVCLVAALASIIVILAVLIRRRKRKQNRGHLSQLQSPDPLVSPEAIFHENSVQFSPVSLLSPQSVSAAYSDPLEFPRNQLYVFTKRVLGKFFSWFVYAHRAPCFTLSQENVCTQKCGINCTQDVEYNFI